MIRAPFQILRIATEAQSPATDVPSLLNLYRSRGSEALRERGITRIRGSALHPVGLDGKHAGLATTATARHGRLESIGYLDNLLIAIEGRLTPRERAVYARALAGQTAHGIASELAIKPPTVARLRRHVYAKLNISSLNE